jgi:Ca2+-binding RTX toxin-like protein
VIEDVKGGENRDVVRGNDAPNQFVGKGGDDSLYGRVGIDVLIGGLGADVLNGGPDDDELYGGDVTDVIGGDDGYIFEGSWGHDSLTDPAGTDRLYFGELTSSVTVNLATGKAYETDSGSFESSPNTVTWTPKVIENVIEKAIGGTADDKLYGDGSDNTLNGQGGNDTMDGSDGNDTMYGRNGNDTMDGGPGVDTVYGDHPSFSTDTGDDTIDVADGVAGDTVDCGPGTDTVEVDAVSGPNGPERADTVVKNPDDTSTCETVNEVLIN